MYKKFAATLAICLLNLPLVFGSADGEKDPLIIDSAHGLKCDREKLICTAEGNVKISKGMYEIHGDKASAFMKKNEQGKMEIRRVEIHENVNIFGQTGEKATAEHAIYDLDTLRIDLTPLKSKQVKVWKDDYLLLADTLAIHLKMDTNKKHELDKIVAKGHVKVSSPDELLESNHAVMTPETNLIVMTGDVIANRIDGQIRGSYAEVNLDTKRSKVLRRKDVSSDERVRVLVSPEKKDTKS